MGRIEGKFAALKQRAEKAFVAYITAGDPDIARTKEIALALERAGVDVLEIGVPFSDPTADGPVIQAASQRALKKGATLDSVLAMIKSLRRESQIPIVLFGYYNPLFFCGTGQFAKRAADAGVDGLLVVDLPLEESAELTRYTKPLGLNFIPVVAPTTGEERIRKITRGASGFLYFVSVLGVTGTKKPDASRIASELKILRRYTSVPIVAGFGISTPEQAREIARHTDGIVIGSAIVRIIAENKNSDAAVRAARFARGIREALNVKR